MPKEDQGGIGLTEGFAIDRHWLALADRSTEGSEDSDCFGIAVWGLAFGAVGIFLIRVLPYRVKGMVFVGTGAWPEFADRLR